jgi:hypothetical protein
MSTLILVSAVIILVAWLLDIRQPKQSDWMRGLLWAESRNEANAWRYESEQDMSSEYGKGIVDYINFRINNRV